MRFLKVEGAGNDFVLVDGRRGAQGLPTAARVRRLLDRHRGIGADGLLWLSRGRGGARAGVRYWNADGGAAAFCGNGARCVALLLLSESRGARSIVFDFGRHRLQARTAGASRVAILTPEPKTLAIPEARPVARWGTRRLRVPAGPSRLSAGSPAWIDSGVPHWILPVTSVDRLDLAAMAPGIRSCPALGRAGTNVDAVEIRGTEVHVRTWERGVEGETLACGSGLVAAGWWAGRMRGLPFPLRLRSRGGDRFLLLAAAEGGLWLEGPARIVYAGTLEPD